MPAPLRPKRMRRKRKLNLIRDESTAPGAVSSLSAEEQARYGNLADVALNQKPESTARVSSRAHQDHEHLKQELLETLEQLQLEKQTSDAA
jgi:hypothetical protein